MVKTQEFRVAERDSFWRMYERLGATVCAERAHEDGSTVRVYRSPPAAGVENEA